MKLFRVLILLVFVACNLDANAQVALQIYKTDTIPGVVTLGSSFSFNAIIRNDSVSPFNSIIDFGYRINGDTALFVSDSISGIQFSSSSSLLNSGDSTSRSITVHVSGSRFQTGPSVVVIWPIANGAYAVDSLVLSFNVVQPNAVSEIENNLIHVFANQSGLQITSANNIILNRVRIFDILGNEILNQVNPSNNIPLPDANSGIYIAEIIYNQNQRKLFRFYY